MAIKLYRCSNVWVKIQGHPCWRVQSALDEQGVDYEIVKGKYWGKREPVVQVSGQRSYPVIQFEDGTVYREESKDMAARIKAGKLFERAQGDQGSPAVSQPTST
jgi:glutaredoxin